MTMMRIMAWIVWGMGAVVAVLLIPVDLIRITWLLAVLTVRYVGQSYLNLLYGWKRGRRPTMEFHPCRPRQALETWDDKKRFVVRRSLTWRLLGWLSGSPQIRGYSFRTDEAGGPGRIELTLSQYGRMGTLLAEVLARL